MGPGNRKFSLFISNRRTFPPPTLIMSDRHWMARTKGDLNYACCPGYNGISRAIFHRAYVSLLRGRFKIKWHFITAHVPEETLSRDIIYNRSFMLNKGTGQWKIAGFLPVVLECFNLFGVKCELLILSFNSLPLPSKRADVLIKNVWTSRKIIFKHIFCLSVYLFVWLDFNTTTSVRKFVLIPKFFYFQWRELISFWAI